MSDFALTLPDHDLTPNEFKELARRIGRAAFVPLFLRYYERVITTEATVEEQRRGLADIARWTNIEEDRKVDPNANLPVFNIIFGAPGSTAASIEAVEVIQPPTHDPPDPVIDSAVEMIPADMLKSFAVEMKEIANGQTTDPAPAPVEQPSAGAGLQTPTPTVRQRCRKQPVAAVPEALPVLQPVLSERAEVSDGVTPERQKEMSDAFAQAVADLDKVLGL